MRKRNGVTLAWFLFSVAPHGPHWLASPASNAGRPGGSTESAPGGMANASLAALLLLLAYRL